MDILDPGGWPSNAGVQVLDLATTDADLTGFYGGFASDGYGYVVPYYNGGYSGKMARFAIDSKGPSFVWKRVVFLQK